MKQILSILVLTFMFSLSSFAQEKSFAKFDREQMIKDTNEMVTYLELDNNFKQSLFQLVDMRIESVGTATNLEEAKKINSQFNNKILAGLPKEKRERLLENKDLHKKIILEL